MHLCYFVYLDDHAHLMPVSLTLSRGEYGVTNTGKQVLTLLGVTEYNDRVFDHSRKPPLL